MQRGVNCYKGVGWALHALALSWFDTSVNQQRSKMLCSLSSLQNPTRQLINLHNCMGGWSTSQKLTPLSLCTYHTCNSWFSVEYLKNILYRKILSLILFISKLDLQQGNSLSYSKRICRYCHNRLSADTHERCIEYVWGCGLCGYVDERSH